MNIQRIVLLSSFIFAASILSGCGGGSSSPATSATPAAASITYSTTSNKGDYGEWTLSDNALKAKWEVINNSGGINYTYTIAATCSGANANSIRQCTIGTAGTSCANGLVTCPTTSPTGTFEMMEVPGVALLVHTTTGGDALQVGFAKDANACNEDVSGDYTFIRTGVGLQDAFGMYRSDKNLLSVVHSDFGFGTPAQKWTDYTSQFVTYLTNGAGALLGDKGCTNGVRTRTIDKTDTLRAMVTASGVFVLDLPAGQGGLLSFNIKKAASLADFAGKSFSGINFPDNGSAEVFHMKFASIVNNKINFSISLKLPQVIDPKVGLNIMSLSTPAALTTPAYANFSTIPTGYTSSPLQATYPAPKDIPGLFKLGEFLDKGRVILAAMKFNGKVIAIGMTNNYRDVNDGTNPSTGNPFTGPGVYNSGNFILFEQ